MKLAPSWSTTPLAPDYAALTKHMLRCTPKERVFDARPYSVPALERAREQWLFRMESEYQSVSSFAGLANQMLEARCDVDLIGTTLRMAQDELRHAELCAEVVTALGGTPVREVAAPIVTPAVHAGCSVEERVLRNVIYGCCVTETVNCARFVDALDTMTDPFLRDVTRQLLSDEATHSQFGFHFLEAWRPVLDPMRASIADYLAFAIPLLDAEYRASPAPPRDEEGLALGLPDGAHTYEIFRATMEAAVLPGLARFGLVVDLNRI